MVKVKKVITISVCVLLVVVIVGGIMGWLIKSKKEKAPIPEHVHTEIIDIGKAATCSETGLSDGKHCTSCGEILVEQTVIPKAEHFYLGGICKFCGLDKNSYYLIGSFNNWKWSEDYRFDSYVVDSNTFNMIAQYVLIVTLDKDTQVNIWKGNGEFGYNNFECNWEYAIYDGSLTITQSGTYRFYLKFYDDGGNSAWVEKL